MAFIINPYPAPALPDVVIYADYRADTGVWQDSGGTTPAVATNDPVARVDDQSGNGLHLYQSTTAAQPTIQTGVLDSGPIIRHATGDYLQATTASDWTRLHNGDDFAVYIVWQQRTANPNTANLLFETGGVTSTQTGICVFYDDRSSQSRETTLIGYVGKSSAGNFEIDLDANTVDAVLDNVWHVSSLGKRGSTGYLTNDDSFGFELTNAVAGSPDTGAPAGPFTVMATTTGTTTFPADWVRILVVDDTITEAEHQQIVRYLRHTHTQQETIYFYEPTVLAHETSEPDHLGFPGLGIAADGTLMIGYTKTTSHEGHDGDLVLIKSTDGGASWGSEEVIFDYSAQSNSPLDFWFTPKFTTLSDGTIFMTVGLRPAQLDGIGYFKSTNNGSTWTGPTQITEPTFTEYAVEGGGILELANGDLLYPFYGRDTGDTYRSSRVLRSQDSGSTWTELATIADGPTDSKDYDEVGLFLADNGDVVAIIREETGLDLYSSVSTDSGATWSTPTLQLGNVWGLPSPIKLDSGEMILCGRFTGVGVPAGLVVSFDDGANLYDRVTFAGSPNFTQTRMIYGDFKQDVGGKIHCAYGSESSGSATADVMYLRSV